MSDRGMKKWAPYASLIEQKGTIYMMKKERSKIKKPSLSEEQASLINDILLKSHGKTLIIRFYEKGFIYEDRFVVKKMDLDQKKLICDRHTIDFNQLLHLEII
jgi:hypothetical protein